MSAIEDILICIRLAGAPGGRTGQEECPPFKMEAKGQASKHPLHAVTYPYIIFTIVHTKVVAKEKIFFIQNLHANRNSGKNVQVMF